MMDNYNLYNYFLETFMFINYYIMLGLKLTVYILFCKNLKPFLYSLLCLKIKTAVFGKYNLISKQNKSVAFFAKYKRY